MKDKINSILSEAKGKISDAVSEGELQNVKSAYIGSFALHDMKGTRRIVIRLSLVLERVRADIIAGTEHPKPISIGTNERPERPILRSNLSIIKAILAI